MNEIFTKLMSLSDAAESIGVSLAYLRQEIARGKKLIVGEDVYKYGTSWVVDKERFYSKYSKKG